MAEVIAVLAGAATLGVIAVCALLTPTILPLIGFTSAGVAAGSIAAFIHSFYSAVTVGSAFAIAQSVGATGVCTLAGAKVLLTGGVTAIFTVFGFLFSFLF